MLRMVLNVSFECECHFEFEGLLCINEVLFYNHVFISFTELQLGIASPSSLVVFCVPVGLSRLLTFSEIAIIWSVSAGDFESVIIGLFFSLPFLSGRLDCTHRVRKKRPQHVHGCSTRDIAQ